MRNAPYFEPADRVREVGSRLTPTADEDRAATGGIPTTRVVGAFLSAAARALSTGADRSAITTTLHAHC